MFLIFCDYYNKISGLKIIELYLKMLIEKNCLKYQNLSKQQGRKNILNDTNSKAFFFKPIHHYKVSIQ